MVLSSWSIVQKVGDQVPCMYSRIANGTLPLGVGMNVDSRLAAVPYVQFPTTIPIVLHYYIGSSQELQSRILYIHVEVLPKAYCLRTTVSEQNNTLSTSSGLRFVVAPCYRNSKKERDPKEERGIIAASHNLLSNSFVKKQSS